MLTLLEAVADNHHLASAQSDSPVATAGTVLAAQVLVAAVAEAGLPGRMATEPTAALAVPAVAVVVAGVPTMALLVHPVVIREGREAITATEQVAALATVVPVQMAVVEEGGILRVLRPQIPQQATAAQIRSGQMMTRLRALGAAVEAVAVMVRSAEVLLAEPAGLAVCMVAAVAAVAAPKWGPVSAAMALLASS